MKSSRILLFEFADEFAEYSAFYQWWREGTRGLAFIAVPFNLNTFDLF
jgi:hypothetical protein